MLHAAGVADYEGVIRARTREQTDRTIAAKVQGTLVLDALTAHEPLDFFLMCSSLGTVLYEMATGRRAFQGKNKTSLIAAIVSSQPPPIASVVPVTPPA